MKVFCLATLLAVGLFTVSLANAEGASQRRSAIVIAVQNARPSIVNINGQKNVSSDNETTQADGPRRVNGMGTGVIIDPRGYIVTNFHVVEGVRQINVTTSESQSYIARLIAHDPFTDLAVIKVPTAKGLPTIKVGTSQDLMQGERVVAIGNAYGYEHTVTCGFISALNRSVRVSDSQMYYNLIQTDASINPGNSGGPLLNVDGEMIGINVAVRVGAQGIGFAIPVDRAMSVVADLISAKRLHGLWHGIEGETVFTRGESKFIVKNVDAGSPAQKAGIQPGDRVLTVEKIAVHNAVDLERAVLEKDARQALSLAYQRGNEAHSASLMLEVMPQNERDSVSSRYWTSLGVRLAPVPGDKLHRDGSPYNGGLRISAIRPGGPAARQGIRVGDVLVGMHKWETLSLDNVHYVLSQPELKRSGRVKFYVVRGGETLFGHLPLIRR